MSSIKWHTLSLTETEREFDTSIHFGLDELEAKNRIQKFGRNELLASKKDSALVVFLKQFKSPLIYVLLGAALIIFIVGEPVDAFIILFVVVFNSVVGTIQEGKAQNTLAALKKFTKTTATVLRNKNEIIIPDEELVPGDIIILQEGEKVPADARIVEIRNLRTDESALTGESVPVHKEENKLNKEDLPTAEQRNMVFKGTFIVGGNGKAIVVATGINTVIGKITQTISHIDTDIPLKNDIKKLSRLIVAIVIGVNIGIIFLGIYYGKPAKEMFLTSVSLAVSIIPEGLPIVITLVLATGVWRMAKINALVKKLQAVEALGQAKIIAVDKTGTITKNEMVVRKVFVGEKIFEVSGSGYESKGDILLGKKVIDPLNHPELLLAGKIAAFSADARVVYLEEEKIWKVVGDPTEAAMLVLAEKIGFNKNALVQESPPINENPFDYVKKYHLTSHLLKSGSLENKKKIDKQFVSVTGAPEIIISLAKNFFSIVDEKNGRKSEIKLLSREKLASFEKILHQMSQSGLRIVAFGFYEAPLGEELDILKAKELTFGGFYAMADSLRPEVPLAMERAKSAGIRVVMITGDHKITAMAIAKEAGIYSENDKVLTGEDLKKMSNQELLNELEHTTVFARVTPEDKMKIIGSYRERKEIIAMTGDGVNDAPSLVAADLGVAMGKIGTEVAKEASDIVLLDDNFGTIVSAIEEGRSILKTIKKVILYLFSTSLGELFTISGAIVLGFPLPILPGQILWLNLVTDGFLDVALAMEPKENGLLEEKSIRPNKYLVDSVMAKRMVVMAIPMMLGSLFVFSRIYETNIAKAWTLTLTVLAIFQWFNAWNCRSDKKSIFKMDFFSNKFLIAATITIIILQVMAVYAPFMNKILGTTPLKISDWLIAISIGSTIVLAEEFRKFFHRRSVA